MDHLHCVGLGAITQQLCLDSIYFSRTAADDLSTVSGLCNNIRLFVLLMKKLHQVIHIAFAMQNVSKDHLVPSSMKH